MKAVLLAIAVAAILAGCRPVEEGPSIQLAQKRMWIGGEQEIDAGQYSLRVAEGASGGEIQNNTYHAPITPGTYHLQAFDGSKLVTTAPVAVTACIQTIDLMISGPTTTHRRMQRFWGPPNRLHSIVETTFQREPFQQQYVFVYDRSLLDGNFLKHIYSYDNYGILRYDEQFAISKNAVIGRSPNSGVSGDTYASWISNGAMVWEDYDGISTESYRFDDLGRVVQVFGHLESGPDYSMSWSTDVSYEKDKVVETYTNTFTDSSTQKTATTLLDADGFPVSSKYSYYGTEYSSTVTYSTCKATPKIDVENFFGYVDPRRLYILAVGFPDLAP